MKRIIQYKKHTKLIGFVLGIIYSAVIPINGNLLSDTLRQKYKEKVMTDHPHIVSSSITVTFFNESALVYPTGSESYQFYFPEGSNVLGRTILPLTFLNTQGRQLNTVKIQTEVTGKAYYLQTIRQLKRRDKLTKNNIKAVLLSTYGKPRDSQLVLTDVLGKEVKSTIAKNTILSSWMVQVPKVIRKGQHIIVFLEKAGVSLKLKGVALDGGVLKENIRVKVNYKSHRILQGEVINETTVRVPFMY